MKLFGEDFSFPAEKFGPGVDKRLIKICKRNWQLAETLEEFFAMCEKDLGVKGDAPMNAPVEHEDCWD
jgi:hypothetical protein